MHYVKEFNINGVATKQVACIELHGKPNAATEGYVGVLGIDMDSPIHDVYKCVAVNGSRYEWELLSSGLSIMSATISGGGNAKVNFNYTDLLTPTLYVVKIGDLILDAEGYLYQVVELNSTYCVTNYCGTRVVAWGMSAYDLALKNGFAGSEKDFVESLYAASVVTNVQASMSGNGDDWMYDGISRYSAAIPIPGILSTDAPIVDVALGADDVQNRVYLEEWSKVIRVFTIDGMLIVIASEIPTCTIPIKVQVTRGIKSESTGIIHGITPTMRINSDTKEWEVSYDKGLSYTSLGVKAVPENFTEELQAEMVQDVLNALDIGDEVSY